MRAGLARQGLHGLHQAGDRLVRLQKMLDTPLKWLGEPGSNCSGLKRDNAQMRVAPLQLDGGCLQHHVHRRLGRPVAIPAALAVVADAADPSRQLGIDRLTCGQQRCQRPQQQSRTDGVDRQGSSPSSLDSDFSGPCPAMVKAPVASMMR